MNRYERPVHRLLLAYPAGWRDERGEDTVGTILDLGRRRLDFPPWAGTPGYAATVDGSGSS